MLKDQLRQQILQKRLNLNPTQVHDKSQSIQDQLVKNKIWISAETIGLYAPVKNEVDTSYLFHKGMEDGKFIYYPRVEQGLKFYEVTDLAELKKGAWGIPEPLGNAHPLGADDKLDLLVIPGIAFDRQGFRIGYGKGFYDRILSQIAKITVGLAYDFQVVEKIPADSWDRQAGYIISESALHHPASL